MVQTNGHNASTLTPVGRLYMQERIVKKKCLCSLDQKTKRRNKFQRRRTDDTYAVRVEGRRKEGFISLTK
jgi:hypothetical protein